MSVQAGSTLFGAVRRHPSALLFAVQLAGVVLFPFMEGSHARRAVFAIFSIAVLGLVVMTVRRSPALTWVALLLGVPAIALRIIEAAYGSDVLLPYSAAPEAGLYFYAAGALIAYTLADHDVTRDELFAVGAIFTLLAWGFASVYTVSQAIESGSYLAATDPMGERTWVELLLLSFTTLSNIGVGDVVPIKPFARGLVMIEQLAGLALIAILIARLVGLTVSWRRSATEADRR